MNEDHIEKLIQSCNSSIATHARCGFSGSPQVAVKIFKRLTGKTARIIPGVTGRVVQWGNEIAPSVVMADAVKLKIGLEQLLEFARQETDSDR